ncbi:hypothetical protein KCU67_g103, partial [Aureobasidium melanogenum]
LLAASLLAGPHYPSGIRRKLKQYNLPYQNGLNFLNNERRTLRLIRRITRASFELLLARLMNMHDVTADRSHSFYLITNVPTNHCIGLGNKIRSNRTDLIHFSHLISN